MSQAIKHIWKASLLLVTMVLLLGAFHCKKTDAVNVGIFLQLNNRDEDDNNNVPEGGGSNDQDVSTSGGQIPNAHFDHWYMSDGYYEPGDNPNNPSIWATGNRGFKSAPGATAAGVPTTRLAMEGNKFAAQLTTRLVPNGSTVGKGIASGSIFTGSFRYRPSGLIPKDDEVRPILGIGFQTFPRSFTFTYRYTPARNVQNGRGALVSGSDAMDAYVVLENRSQGSKRLGVGWFRSGKTQSNWATETVQIKYGEDGNPPSDLEDYEKRALKFGHGGNIAMSASAQPIVAWGDTALLRPTHITVVFASSFRGDDFIGAPGSQLVVDDFQLLY